MDIMVIAKCMVKLLIVLVLGFGLYKADIIDAATSKKFYLVQDYLCISVSFFLPGL